MHCYSPVFPQHLSSCSAFWTQYLSLLFLTYLFVYHHIFSPIPCTFHLCSSIYFPFCIFPLPSSLAIAIPYIAQLGLREESLFPVHSHSLYSTYITTSHLVLHPLSSGTMLFRGIPCIPLYSCAFSYKGCAGLLSCCAFCSLVTCTAFSSLLLFSTSILGHSHLKCPTFQYLKHLIPSSISCHLTLTSSLTPHCITLLVNTSN